MRKMHIFFWIACALAALILLIYALQGFNLFTAEREPESTVAIIGGADGPTAIFVASSPLSTRLLIIAFIALLISAAGIILTRRKSK